MSKGKNAASGLGISAAVGMAVYLLFQLLLALLIVKGVLPEEKALGLQIVSGGMAGFLAGVLAAKRLPWGRLPAAAAAAAGVALMTALSGTMLCEGLLLTGGTLLRLAVMLAGGLLAGFFGAGKGGRRRKRNGLRAAARK